MDAVLFDAHLHGDGLSDQDLESLAYFGVQAALLPAHDPSGTDTTKGLLAHFDDLVRVQARRLWAHGIRAFVALGVHPARVPWHGLDAVLAELPWRVAGGQVVAVGEIGLDKADAREQAALARQLELAEELRLPVLLHTPANDKERVTKRLLALVRESGLAPERVLVDHVTAKTVKLVRECGFFAGLTVHPGHLAAEEAAALVARYGCEGVVLSSDAGNGTGDMLSLSRAGSVLRESGLAEGVVRRVLGQNALDFYRIDRRSLAEPPPRVKRG